MDKTLLIQEFGVDKTLLIQEFGEGEDKSLCTAGQGGSSSTGGGGFLRPQEALHLPATLSKPASGEHKVVQVCVH